MGGSARRCRGANAGMIPSLSFLSWRFRRIEAAGALPGGPQEEKPGHQRERGAGADDEGGKDAEYAGKHAHAASEPFARDRSRQAAMN